MVVSGRRESAARSHENRLPDVREDVRLTVMTSAVAKIKEQFANLSDNERLQLLLELWSTLSGENDVELTAEEKALLDQRLAEHEANPHDTIPAEEAIARLRGKGRT